VNSTDLTAVQHTVLNNAQVRENKAAKKDEALGSSFASAKRFKLSCNFALVI